MSKLYVGTAKNPKLATLQWDYELTGLRGKARNLRVYFGKRLLETMPNGRLPKLSEYRVGKGSVFQIKQTTLGWMRVVRFYLDGVELRKTSRDPETYLMGAANSIALYGIWCLVVSLISGVSIPVSAVMAGYGVYLARLHRRQPDQMGRTSAIGYVSLLVMCVFALMLNGFYLALVISYGLYLYCLFALNHLVEKRANVAESA